MKIRSRPSKDLDFVQVFAANAAELRRLSPRAIRAAKPEGILWEKDYRPVAFAKIDDTWTTLRFRKVVTQ
jgi:hypothetical protein